MSVFEEIQDMYPSVNAENLVDHISNIGSSECEEDRIDCSFDENKQIMVLSCEETTINVNLINVNPNMEFDLEYGLSECERFIELSGTLGVFKIPINSEKAVMVDIKV
jgi:hypothetical protein